MQIANTIASKLIVASVAIATIFAVAMPAQAQTVEELQDMIADLMAQVAALSGGSSSSAACTFTMSLTVGSQGAEVTCLQNYLIGKGFSIPAGATGYFGAQTQAAVAAWQSANGVTPAAGYFGPVSQAKYKAIAGTGTTPTPGTPSGDLQGGAGDISIDQTSSDISDEVMEGEEEIAVLGFDVEAEDSDVEVTALRVEFEHEGAGSDSLDDYATEVSVWLDGEMVGSSDVEDFNESSDIYSRSISLDGAIVREGEEGRFQIAVSAVNNVDSDDLSEIWEVALDQVRFEDATGASLSDTTGTGVVAGASNGPVAEDFTFEDLSTAGDVELSVSEEDEEVNDAHTVPVDDSSDTNDVEILSFTLEADGSDMELNQLIFDITSSGAGVTEIANDFRLMMGDEEVGDLSYDLNQDNTGGDSSASSTDAAIALLFTDLDDDEVAIEEGEEVTFTLLADINDIDGGFGNSDYLGAALSGNTTDIDADDENNDSVTDITGSASSNNIAFASSGLLVELTDSSATSELGLDSTSTDDQGKFVMEFEVTAFENTAFVELEAGSSTDAATDNYGVAFQMETSANASAAGTVSGTSLERVSGGSISGDYVRIDSGETAVLRLTVYFNPTATGIYRVQMNNVGFAATGIAATADEDTVPAEDFQSDSIQVQN